MWWGKAASLALYFRAVSFDPCVCGHCLSDLYVCSVLVTTDKSVVKSAKNIGKHPNVKLKCESLVLLGLANL